MACVPLCDGIARRCSRLLHRGSTWRTSPSTAFEHFITRRGDQLYDGDKPFRFISFNIPNLQVVEDNFGPRRRRRGAGRTSSSSPTRWSRSARWAAGRADLRAQRPPRGLRHGRARLRPGPGDFNEEAFARSTSRSKIANKKGVRLIIPLVDNWKWQGGAGEYAAFRGKQREDFWTDEQVIADFEQTIRYVLNRVNTRTGVALPRRSGDPRLGDGQRARRPPAWTAEIAAYLKQLDPNHLVIDGDRCTAFRRSRSTIPTSTSSPRTTTRARTSTWSSESREAAAPRGRSRISSASSDSSRWRKPGRALDAVDRQRRRAPCSGACDSTTATAGFYWHSEPAGERLYKAYHWPGFDSGRRVPRTRVAAAARRQRARIRGTAPTASTPPHRHDCCRSKRPRESRGRAPPAPAVTTSSGRSTRPARGPRWPRR